LNSIKIFPNLISFAQKQMLEDAAAYGTEYLHNAANDSPPLQHKL